MKKHVICIVVLSAYSLVATVIAIAYRFKTNAKDKIGDKADALESVEHENNIKRNDIIRVENENLMQLNEEYDINKKFEEVYEKAKDYAKMMKDYTSIAKIWQGLYDKKPGDNK
ncbi:hypothetical protein BDAP_002503 [Binucleata daphniae]